MQSLAASDRVYAKNVVELQEKLPKSIETYADEVLVLSGQHPALNALMAKAIYLYETANYVGARDFLNRGKYLWFRSHNHHGSNMQLFFSLSAKNASSDGEDKLCLRLLAETHLKLHAFTLAEYYYTKINLKNVNYLHSLVQQKCKTKCQEAIASIPSIIENDSTLTDDEKEQLIEIHVKYGSLLRKF